VSHNNSLNIANNGDSLKDRLAHKLRMLEEEHALRSAVAASAAKRGVRGEQGKDEAREALGRNRIAGERKSAAELEAEMNEVRAQWEDHITRRLGPGGKSTDSPSPDAEMDELRALRTKWEGQITGSFSRANLSEKSTEDASSGELSDLGGPRGTSGEVATKTWCGSKKKAASSAFEKGQMPAQVRESVSPEATFLGAAAAQRGRKAEEEQGKRDPEAVSTNLSVGFDKIRTIVQAIEKAPKCIKEVLLLEEVIPRREVFSRGKYR
jgi:hypothetical protein